MIVWWKELGMTKLIIGQTKKTHTKIDPKRLNYSLAKNYNTNM